MPPEVTSSGEAYPVFILTLPGAEARRAPLVDWLEAQGLGYELFLGVDGRSGLAPEWEPQLDRPAAARALGRRMSDGEFACGLSHQEIYRQVLERGLPGAVVLEDDAVPTRAFAAFMADRAYRRAPLILLDHSNTRVRPGGLDLLPGINARPVALPPFRTTGYSLDAATARALRERSLPLAYLPDWPCDISELGALAAWPRLIGHPEDPAQSTLEAGRGDKRRRAGRFLRPAYWRRWWRKRRSERLDDDRATAE
jgi:glycosyl transferase family 25